MKNNTKSRLVPWLLACGLSLLAVPVMAADEDGDGISDAVETAVGLDPEVANTAMFVVDEGAGSLVFMAPDVAVDSDGNLHIAMLGIDPTTYSTNTRSVHYALVSADGELLIAPTEIETPDAVRDGRPDIVVTDDNKALVVWASNQTVRFARINPAGDSQDGDAATPGDIIEVAETAIGVVTNNGHLSSRLNSRGELVVMSSKNSNLMLTIVDEDGNDIVAEFDTGINTESRATPVFDFDENDDIHAIFRSNDDLSGEGVTAYAMFDGATGATLIDATRIYDDLDIDVRGFAFNGVHVDADGIVHTVFGDKRNTVDENDYQSGSLFYTQLDPSLDDQDGNLATEDGTNATQIAIKLMDDVYLTNGWYMSAFVGANDLFYVMPTTSGKNGHSAMAIDLEGNIVAPRRDLNSHRSSITWRTKQAHLDGEWAVWSDSVQTGNNGTYRIIAAKAMGMVGLGASGSATAQSTAGALAHFEAFDDSGLPSGAETLPDDLTATGSYWRVVVSNLNPGGSTTVTVDTGEALPEGWRVVKYDGSDWSEHGASQISDTSFAITLVDGGAGDADGEANGIIVNLAGLAVFEAEPAETPVQTSGGGGGCTIGSERQPFDPLFPALLLLAGLYLYRRHQAN